MSQRIRETTALSKHETMVRAHPPLLGGSFDGRCEIGVCERTTADDENTWQDSGMLGGGTWL